MNLYVGHTITGEVQRKYKIQTKFRRIIAYKFFTIKKGKKAKMDDGTRGFNKLGWGTATKKYVLKSCTVF